MLNRNTPILIVGFGSIGKRHLRNLLGLGYKNLTVFDPSDAAFRGEKNITRLPKLTQKTAEPFEVALVCSPNDMHIKHATLLARANCHLFIEKPLSHSLAGISDLTRISRQKKLVTMIGCNMRFHPCLVFIKQFLEKRKLGDIYSIRHEFGYYLPHWRPKQDYRKNYAAKKKMGGGIILDDIHEFDLLFWLNNFAPVKQSKFIYGRVGSLDMETEDSAVALFEFQNGLQGSVHCDYLQKSYSRGCKIVGEKGNLRWDFTENVVWMENKNGKKNLFEVKRLDFNEVYVDEVKYFFKHIKAQEPTFNDLDTAYNVLKYCVERK